MAGGFSVGGLISGLDTNELISQLMLIERQPILRLQARIETFEAQREAVREVRTQLMTLRNAAQDFRFNSIFSQFAATTSEETVLGVEISGPAPVIGSYTVEILQMASATVAHSSAVLASPINATATLENSGMTTDVTAGAFTVNGIGFTVDPTSDSLTGILSQITASAAGVNATYDGVTDTVTFENQTPGDTSIINFGGSDDTSNFLAAINITEATQSDGGSGATTATSTRNLGAVDPNETLNLLNFASGAVAAGNFYVNGVSIDVDPATDSLSDVLQRITDSDAGVTATYDSASDQVRIVSDTLGSRTVAFAAGTSGFLNATNLASAVQEAGDDAQFTINGGAVQSRNTNEISDAIGDVTISLLSVGSSTVAVSGDDDQIVEDINGFLTAFNESIDQIREQVGQEGDLAGDGTIQSLENYLWQTIFSSVSDLSGDFSNLVEIGITTGDAFDSGETSHLQLDEDTFREALRDDRTNVAALFNNADETGIADHLFDYLDQATRTTGYLNARAKSNGTIDQQIRGLNDQIDRLEDRVAMKEVRLRGQFTRLEQLTASFQSQSIIISSMGFSTFM